MYGKHFQSTYTGSMVGAGPVVFAVWGYVIAHTRDSLVELNPVLLAAILGCPAGDIESAINFLCLPDTRSRSKISNGQRLIKEGEFIYRVPTHAKYRSIRNDEDRRAYMRVYMQQYRNKNKGLDDVKASVNSDKPRLAHSEAESESDTEKEKIGTQSKQPRPETESSPARQPNGCPPCPHEAIKNLYNEILTGLPPIRLWTESRRKALLQRWRKTEFQSIEFWRRYFEHVRDVPFLHGNNDRRWQANIDFLLKETSIVKIMEGQYEAP